MLDLKLAYAKHRTFGGGVRGLNAYTYYLLGSAIHGLKAVRAGAGISSGLVLTLDRGRDALSAFVANEDKQRFRSSIESAETLSGLVRGMLDSITQPGPWPRSLVSAKEESAIEDALRTFEQMLGKELEELPLFCVDDTGNLSTFRLLTKASDGYPKQTLSHLSEFQKTEIDCAGRCLAFRQPTASAFHILRAAESLIKDFAVKANGAPPKKRDLGHYADLLETNGADKKVVSIIRQINNLYRKPLMHPEDVLTQDEAISHFCICQSLIEALVADMSAKGFLS